MIKEILALHQRVAELEKRLSGTVRHGPVAEVNPSEGWVRLDLGEGDSGKLLSPKIPYAQLAGALKVHAPPSQGQNMTILAPGGDMRQAMALPMTWSGQNASPGNSGEENVLTFGSVTIKLNGDAVRFEVGGFVLEISGEGLAMAGGGVGHDGKNIGATHTHPGIERGGASTDPPNGGGPQP